MQKQTYIYYFKHNTQQAKVTHFSHKQVSINLANVSSITAFNGDCLENEASLDKQQTSCKRTILTIILIQHSIH